METQESSVPEKMDSKSDLRIDSIDNNNKQETGSLPNEIDNGMTEQSSSSLDEGEIVDDEDGEILAKDEKSLSHRIECVEKSPNQHQNLKKESYNNEDIISEVDVDESEEKFEEGECCEPAIRKANNSIDEIGSNYSDWSESEDDDLLKGGLDQPTEITNIKSEPMDSDHEAIAVMNPIITDVDLEAISDDDFESTQIDDIQNKTLVGGGESNDFEKIFPKEEDDDDDESSFYPIQVKSDTIKSISILDTLKIDWKSLISNRENSDDIEGQEERTTEIKEDKDRKARSEDFRKQNSMISVLNRIGFSHRFAGEKMTPLINEYLSKQLGEDYQPMLNPMPALHEFYRNKLKQNILGPTVKAGSMIMNGDKDRSFLELCKHPF